LLSLGGGYPTDYYLPSEEVAADFAKFLMGAFGPVTDAWTAKKGPRPFGDAVIDGFDLDLEATVDAVPNKDDIFSNYGYFVNQLKSIQDSLLITAAPQCEVPDPRLADAIIKAPFDMIFTQFYNTDACSARLGYQELSTKGTGFTFGKWADWLKANSKNPDVKLYLGLPAGEAGAPSYPAHYLKPKEANDLVKKWKKDYSSIFGGIMLWEAQVNKKNVDNCKTYSSWMKLVLDGSFTNKYKTCVSSSSSSIKPSSTKASSTIVSSTKASSTIASSTKASSTLASSTKASPSLASSTVASTTSAAVSPTATIKTPDGTCGDKGTGVAYSCQGYNFGNCCSEYGYCGGEQSAPAERAAYCGTGCNPLYGECDGKSSSSASASSSVHVSSSASASSSVHVSSSASASSSVVASSSSASVYSASTPAASSSSLSSVASSSVHASSSAPASSSVHGSSTSSTASIYSATIPASSSVYSASSSSVPYPSGNATYGAYPTGTASVVYPQGTTKQVYPHSSSNLVYPSASSSVYYPVLNTSCTTSTMSSSSVPVHAASSTPCTTSNVAASSSAPIYYGAASSSAPVYYGAASSSAPVYGAASSSGKAYDSYPASSSAKAYGAAYPPSVTSKPTNDYPSYPVKVITTTYVDSCETGVTTKTETITKTVCPKCTEDSITSVYVCNNCGPSVVTYTITKPNTPATDVPSVPTAPAKPSSPSYGGEQPHQPAKPSTPSYGGEKPKEPVKPSTPSYGGDKPVNTPTYDIPKKHEVPAGSTTVAIVYVTPVPVAPSVVYTPVAYPSVPAKNGTSGYPVKPSGTGSVPTKPTSYVPPAQFTGAASHVGVGMTGLLAVVAGLLVL
jgi:chitinase